MNENKKLDKYTEEKIMKILDRHTSSVGTDRFGRGYIRHNELDEENGILKRKYITKDGWHIAELWWFPNIDPVEDKYVVRVRSVNGTDKDKVTELYGYKTRDQAWDHFDRIVNNEVGIYDTPKAERHEMVVNAIRATTNRWANILVEDRYDDRDETDS